MLNRVLWCIIALAVVAQAIDEADDWGAWKLKYRKEYKTRSDDARRRDVFHANIAEIKRMNDEPTNTAKFAPNAYSDLTADEFERQVLGLRVSYDADEFRRAGIQAMPRSRTVTEIPPSVDYRRLGAVGPALDQANCGSCWAFSVGGMCESVNAYFGQRPDDADPVIAPLSMQQLVDCTSGCGCDGGDTVAAAAYAVRAGLMRDEDYRYTAVKGSCAYNRTAVAAKFVGFATLPRGDENALARALAERGPVSIAIDASSAVFRNFRSGVIYDSRCGNRRLNHAILLVGYTRDYWIARNSWGTDWGLSGFVQIARNAGNMCGVASYSVALTH